MDEYIWKHAAEENSHNPERVSKTGLNESA